jgi:hypothetical protein
MFAEEATQSVSMVGFLLRAGWLPIFCLGVPISVWGIINLVRSSSPYQVLLQSLFSLLPGVMGIIAIYSAYVDLARMAAMTTAPKPAEFAAAAGAAISSGIFGIAGSIIPLTLGLFAMWNFVQKQSPRNKNESNS